MYLFAFYEGSESEKMIILVICLTALASMCLYFGFKMIEMVYVMRNRRPLYTHFYTQLKKLTSEQKHILINDFKFFHKLDAKNQKYFEHRVASFLNDKKFIGRDGLDITEEMKVLISATAVMLTFGFRNYFIGLVDKIFIFPNEFYSNINEEYHKGEFNPTLQALALSWKHFKEGYNDATDNINLGIHEFAHAIHMNSIKEKDVSSGIFEDSFNELTHLLSGEQELREKLVASRYFRDYAYTNQFEFIAVIIENFIETPQEFKSQFPKVYDKTKQMLNFNFAGY